MAGRVQVSPIKRLLFSPIKRGEPSRTDSASLPLSRRVDRVDAALLFEEKANCQ